jgi:hypothetical protein
MKLLNDDGILMCKRLRNCSIVFSSKIILYKFRLTAGIPILRWEDAALNNCNYLN